MADAVALWIGRLLLLVLGIGALAVAADWALSKVLSATGSYWTVVNWQLEKWGKPPVNVPKKKEGSGDG